MGHNHGINCYALVPPTSHLVHLAVMARLKAPPPATSAAEFIATGSRKNTIKLWDTRGSCLQMLICYDNWVSAVVFHPGVRYLISAADEKTLRCWDSGQEGICTKVLEGVHEQFITCRTFQKKLV